LPVLPELMGTSLAVMGCSCLALDVRGVALARGMDCRTRYRLTPFGGALFRASWCRVWAVYVRVLCVFGVVLLVVFASCLTLYAY